jgi:hypothetical protein
VLQNNGVLDMTSSNFAFTGLETEEPFGPVFYNDGELKNDSSEVNINWYTSSPGILPSSPECVICILLDFEADPPTGICGLARSEGVVFEPLAFSAFPPSLEPLERDWECRKKD